MELLRGAMRRPISVLVAVLAVIALSGLALTRMPVDIFPNLDLPVIYVAQTYGGMDPSQMEGYLASYYEYHFLYIAGIDHVESRSIQNVSLIKLYFHPGTDMSQALAQTISYAERSRAFMPPGTVAPFIMRYDAGSVPVGQLVFSSDTKTVGEIQDVALFKVRPMFATLPGVSAPPPFGGNQRSVIVRADPDHLRAYNMSPDELIGAIAQANAILPAGNVRTGDLNRLASINSVVVRIKDLEAVPVRKGTGPTVYVRDVASVENGSDILTGYALVNGRRTVYIPVTKRSDASTLDVVSRVKGALPRMQKALPDDIRVSFEFDQSPVVTRAIRGLVTEGALGALLTGLLILIFLADPRGAAIVVTTIPCAILGAIVALWLCGQSLNIMTLGGLALAIGILVDEATVAIENVHTHLDRGEPPARAAYRACAETIVPRFLAMLCILAVFLPSLFMVGIPRSLFVPLSLAVGFSMAFSYVLSSTLVPVLAAWWLPQHVPVEGRFSILALFQRAYRGVLGLLLALRWLLVPAYLVGCAFGLAALVPLLGTDIFPAVDVGQFQLRLRAPAGTRVERTEVIARKALDLIAAEAGGPDRVAISLGFVGTQPASYPINTIYLWTGGPHEAVLLVSLREPHPPLADFLERVRKRLATELPGVTASFEAGDVISQVMNFGAPTPVEVAVSGPNLTANRGFAARVKAALEGIPFLRDLQYAQPLDYPTLDIQIDRDRAGQLGTTVQQVGRSLLAATSSSRFVQPNYWRDPASGVAYQVQVEIPQHRMSSVEDIENVPLAEGGARVGDVASITPGTMPGEYDRYNMQRMVTLSANIARTDLGAAAAATSAAVAKLGEPPKGVSVEVRGQVPALRQTLGGLQLGLAMAFVVIFLLLAASFQSFRLALVSLATVPAVLLGVAGALFLTRTTLNVQSYMGAIMAVGVSTANAILLITFAESARQEGAAARDAALAGAVGRLRPIVITALAMIAGMVPMALAFGEGGEQTAPLGRAVIGGLAASTVAVLVVLPLVYTLAQGGASRASSSLYEESFDQ